MGRPTKRSVLRAHLAAIRTVMTRAFVEVAPFRELPDESARAVRIGETSIAIFRIHERIFALDDPCIRCGTSLAAGALAGSTVTCAQCGWHYDVATGSVNGLAALCTDTFEVRVSGSPAMIAIRDPRAA
jgi:nitrite reductase/ring-hydroxylating ferredoxin subunit